MNDFYFINASFLKGYMAIPVVSKASMFKFYRNRIQESGARIQNKFCATGG
jgi:hypothetical protein